MLFVRKLLGEDPEVFRFRIWAGVFVFWVFSGVMSCDEIKYARKGQTAVAERVGASSSRPQSHATYRWQDSKTGDNRNKVFEISGGRAPERIEMQYIPGGLDSRPAGSASWVSPSIFLGLTLLGVGWFVYTGIKDKRR